MSPRRTRSPRRSQLAAQSLSIARIAWLVYLGVAGAWLIRLFYGLASALLLWYDAEPVPAALSRALLPDFLCARVAPSPLRSPSAPALSCPPTTPIGMREKLRIVLAHERSHIRQGDFYLQLLAAFYAAVVWFSPLGWWLKRKLSDLAETISDRAGLEQAASRSVLCTDPSRIRGRAAPNRYRSRHGSSR